MQEQVRTRTPTNDNEKIDSNNEGMESNEHTQKNNNSKQPEDMFVTDNSNINYTKMLQNGLERRTALINKRRRSRTPPQQLEINTEDESSQFENSLHKYVLAAFAIYLFWILFK